jgi:hypothetical protein
VVSLGQKMNIMEMDARRQMERELKDALLAVLYQKRIKMPFLKLKVRREHLIEDSLNQVRREERRNFCTILIYKGRESLIMLFHIDFG